ncbi:phage holin family protein [Qipengyuania marisflavi]|uniref:Phage holin family protein n=1 Tax=Qipengyuania marisflavi TaxID=2486356 RepID=A0A5S3P8S9_9SPHN|nr:phage holin family protein [Qipengyuania marisflavi]TMM49836.1 phage holin family protein [Qipengyuania marisflavi]
MTDETEAAATAPPPPIDLPDDHEPPEQGDGTQFRRSLVDDLLALFDDGKTYAEAELRYQRGRAGFAANRVKYALAYGLAAFGVLHLALIGLTVGLVIALAPLIGGWAATAIVVIGLIALGVMLLQMLKSKIDDIRNIYSDKAP